jgi:BirA family biotin operon repressor/biotin-[acetyl-CoA-carboxylase] ligase
MFSLVFQPIGITPDQQIRLSWYTAVIWIKCLHRFSIAAQIKWPNDIFVGENKLGGILIEQQILGNTIAWSIVGCGMNVNAHPELKNTSSIFEQTQVHFKPRTLLNEFLELFNGHLDLLYSNHDKLKADFEAELWGKYTIQQFEDVKGQLWKAKIMGVDALGRLVLEQNDELLHFDLQEIKLKLP